MPGPWRMLLLLGLLAGLFGMHALGPGDAVAVSSQHGPAASSQHGHAGASHHEYVGAPHHAPARAMGAHAPVTADEAVCHSDDSGGGHARHADPTCASGAVGAGPALPALVPDPAGGAVSGDIDGRSVAAAPEGGRAPPSLAELQILRT